ncbi:unnamed protein product [Cuscuta campestris]|uniref:procollagen-proline 4-dioxygenase n=1 Tax=Cuscuta campestris TaxID=132261 RepID=A0A484LME8_9ASTE|nr:unnamed protein product [Cuscuta campestris]
MARLLSVLILVTLATSFNWFRSQSRKELRIKQVIQDQKVKPGGRTNPTMPNPSRALQISWHPRVFLYQEFLSEEECDQLMVSDKTIVAEIEERISAWTFLPRENSKPLKVLQYEGEDPEQTYSYLDKNSTQLQDEPLMATVILYLSNVTAGGQILFPKSTCSESNCGESNCTIKPTKGNTLLFFNSNLDATPDDTSSHARCPVIEGKMGYAIKLFYLRAVSRAKRDAIVSDDCVDEDDNCPRWAAMGECSRNPVFMVGSPDYYGTCRRSCSAC